MLNTGVRVILQLLDCPEQVDRLGAEAAHRHDGFAERRVPLCRTEELPQLGQCGFWRLLSQLARVAGGVLYESRVACGILPTKPPAWRRDALRLSEQLAGYEPESTK